MSVLFSVAYLVVCDCCVVLYGCLILVFSLAAWWFCGFVFAGMIAWWLFAYALLRLYLGLFVVGTLCGF